MRDFQLQTDLERVVIDGFAFALGVSPSAAGKLRPPLQGYTVSYVGGQEDEPDTYSFCVVVSHERLAGLLKRAFDLLPDHVYGIVEIGSRDAYRTTDVFVGLENEPISLDRFRRVWAQYQPFLLEDGSIAAGANSEDPFIEIFLDQAKALMIHVPLSMREDVESMLHEVGLEEVQQLWPAGGGDEPEPEEDRDEEWGSSQIRPVLDLSDDTCPDVDELLLNLRHDWNLELNVDPESNIDEGGRNLGSTLWHAVVIVDQADPSDVQSPSGAYASIWATAGSLHEMEHLMGQALAKHPQWAFGEVYTIDRVAFDERPDELADLSPNRRLNQVHMVTIEPWSSDEGTPDGSKRPSEESAEDRDER